MRRWRASDILRVNNCGDVAGWFMNRPADRRFARSAMLARYAVPALNLGSTQLE